MMRTAREVIAAISMTDGCVETLDLGSADVIIDKLKEAGYGIVANDKIETSSDFRGEMMDDTRATTFAEEWKRDDDLLRRSPFAATAGITFAPMNATMATITQDGRSVTIDWDVVENFAKAFGTSNADQLSFIAVALIAVRDGTAVAAEPATSQG